MSYTFDSRAGQQLYRLLPEVYRTRDRDTERSGKKRNNDDLAKYLDAHGYLLDLIHATLEQQLKDSLSATSRNWLLPYFAKLLAADMVSPDPEGMQAEITNGVLWRQRKGTLKCIEEIGEAVGQMEVEIQEGWQRVAVTPRIGMVVMPANVYDDTLNPDMTIPSRAARHPALPTAMIDFRRASRAVMAEDTNPAARISSFGGIRQTWRQTNRFGVPCFRNSFDDVSRRTVDIRTPSVAKGHYHHKRLLAYAPPPVGFFQPDPVRRKWSERKEAGYKNIIAEKLENGVLTIRNLSGRTVEITDNVILTTPKVSHRIEGLNFSSELVVEEGSLVLSRIEAEKVQVNTASSDQAVLKADNCLFKTLSVGTGPVRLDSCTILGTAFLDDIEARDCIFMNLAGTKITGEIQYSRIPGSAPFHEEKINLAHCTSDVPIFFKSQTRLAAQAVIVPATPVSIYAGAHDGKEMGYYHNGRKGRPVRLEGDFTGSDALFLQPNGGFPLSDLVFEGSLQANNGPLILKRSAVKSLLVTTAATTDGNDMVIPSLDARDCLFDAVKADAGLVRLEYCTVMETLDCRYLQASDCILAGSVENVQLPSGTGTEPPFLHNCIRYSAVLAGLAPEVQVVLGLMDANHKKRLGSNTSKKVFFVVVDTCTDNGHERLPAKYGEPGYGVLALVAPRDVRFGAEDGGEMGAFHHKYYCLRYEAMLEKMRSFLPVGIEPVLIHDPRLLQVWPGF